MNIDTECFLDSDGFLMHCSFVYLSPQVVEAEVYGKGQLICIISYSW